MHRRQHLRHKATPCRVPYRKFIGIEFIAFADIRVYQRLTSFSGGALMTFGDDGSGITLRERKSNISESIDIQTWIRCTLIAETACKFTESILISSEYLRAKGSIGAAVRREKGRRSSPRLTPRLRWYQRSSRDLLSILRSHSGCCSDGDLSESSPCFRRPSERPYHLTYPLQWPMEQVSPCDIISSQPVPVLFLQNALRRARVKSKS